MFEVGFSELIMVGLVALLVVGPERLPRLARIAGIWLGKARNTADAIKAEIRHELEIEESRQMLKQTRDEGEAAMQEINAALEAFPTVTRFSQLTDAVDDSSKPVSM
jgi:sec-independent protein translocase protein TatB